MNGEGSKESVGLWKMWFGTVVFNLSSWCDILLSYWLVRESISCVGVVRSSRYLCREGGINGVQL